MGDRKSNVPLQVEEKLGFFDAIRRMFKRTSIITDAAGKTKYIAYPIKKDFSTKQKEDIRKIEINDIDILTNDEERCLFQLYKLQTLALGKGVLGISYGSIPYWVKRLELGPDLKQIPEGAIKESQIKTIIGDDFYLSTTSGGTNTEIYFDQDGRFHFEEHGRYSWNQVDYNSNHGIRAVAATESAARVLAKNLLDSTGTTDVKENIYVYAEDLGKENKYSIHAIVDDRFPIPSDDVNKIPDDKLVGIFVNNVSELDMRTLAKYPNLRNIVVGKSVIRVIKADTTEKTNVLDEKGVLIWRQTDEKGGRQSIKFLAPNIQFQEAITPVQVREDKTKTVTREDRTLDD